MLETFRKYFPYAEVIVLTGSEILQLREDIATTDYYYNDCYYNNKYITKELDPETTYIFVCELCDITDRTGQYREVCIEVYKD